MRKTMKAKMISLLMALVLMVTAVPMGNVTAEAATKPGKVSKLKVTNVTKNSAKVTWKKAKKAKGYQIRVYKGKKQVLSKKTKALKYTVKKLKANTKYTVKVRAYNGNTYGKQVTVSFKTAKKDTAADDDSLDITSLKVLEVSGPPGYPQGCGVKLECNKTKVPAIYVASVYKGSELVYDREFFDNIIYCTGLSRKTEYTIKVKAYPNPYSGEKRYGKEASVTVKPPDIVMTPGTTDSEGDELVAEYNGYVAYIAADWSDPVKSAWAFQDSSITCLNTAWLRYTGMMFATFTYSDAYTDKYQAYKHNCGTLDAITDYYADVLRGCGLTVTYRDVTDDYDRYNQLYADGAKDSYHYQPYYDSRIHKGLVVATQDGKTNLAVIGFGPNPNGLMLSVRDTASLVDGRTILWTCPDCGNEVHEWYQLGSILQTINEKTTSALCRNCMKRFTVTNPYYGTDPNDAVYIRTATVVQ